MQKYGEPDLGFLGLLPIIGKLIEDDDKYIEFREEQGKIFGPMHGEYLPPNYFFYVADPEVAKFLMGLPPSLVKKAGLTPEILMSDPNGFKHNLLMEEGEGRNKIIQKYLAWTPGPE